MAEVTRGRTGELMRGLFKVLMAQPQGLQAREAIAQLKGLVPPTEYELGSYASGGERYDKLVRFATVDCVKAGWMIKERGAWLVTPEGGEAYRQYKEPGEFYRMAVQGYRAWQATQQSGARDVVEELGVEESEAREAALTLEQAEEWAWGEVQEYLANMPPYDVQQLVGALLTAMGYYVAWIAPPGKDGGVDLLAHRDPIGATRPRIKVQVKRVKAAVPVEGLRAFMAVLSDDDVGLFISTGGFTRDALLEARTQEKRRITLIDMARLFELWVEHYDKLDDAAKRHLPLKPVYFLAPRS